MRKNCVTCKHDRLRSPICDECYNTSDAPTKWKAAEYYEPDTNADRIRAMSDEELAEHLDDWQCWGGGMSKEWWLDWLKQPAE